MMIMPVVCGKQEGKREKVEKEKNAGQRKKIFSSCNYDNKK